jgi:hypothetical protein
MKRLPVITPLRFAFAAFVLSASFDASAQLKAIELAVETPANTTVLPSGPASTLVVTPCVGCKPLSLPASARSRYFIGNEQVTLAELKKQLANRPKAMLLILYRKDSRELSRVIASAP